MRKYVLLIVLSIVVLAGSAMVLHQVKAQTSSVSGPTLIVSPPASPLTKTTSLVILGSGYKPNQVLNILFNDGFGSIGALEDTVKADDKGNFVTSWVLGNYSRGGILPEGVTLIMTADENFNVIASAPVAFADTGAAWAKWPAWAKGLFPKPKPKATATPKPAATGTPKPEAAAPKPEATEAAKPTAAASPAATKPATVAPTAAPTQAAAAKPAGPRAIPAGHATAACAACHATGAGGAPPFPASPSHADFVPTMCAGCHK